jgi:membrane complex biogenesis BtpA family protein
MEAILEEALSEAQLYKKAGFDGLIVENTHDTPYLKGRVEPETVAAMTVIAGAIKHEVGLPLGLQILAGANLEALAVAVSLGLDFIRAEGFVFAHVGDEGIHEACAPQLIRRRFQLQAQSIRIYVDIKKKHASHALTEDVDLAETARAADFFRADGVVVTGVRTGSAPSLEELQEARAAVELPVLIGSGVSPENIAAFSSLADALIIGSYVKHDGRWQNKIDLKRCDQLLSCLPGR